MLIRPPRGFPCSYASRTCLLHPGAALPGGFWARPPGVRRARLRRCQRLGAGRPGHLNARRSAAAQGGAAVWAAIRGN